jgi:hypothetical protein
VGDAAKEEIGAGGSPAGGGALGFNDDDAARERGEAERRCGERRGSGSPFIGQRRKGRRRPRRWGAINARRRWSLVVVPFREMRGRGGGAGALKALIGGRERGAGVGRTSRRGAEGAARPWLVDGAARGRGRPEVGGEVDRWVPPVGEREREERERWTGPAVAVGPKEEDGPTGV